MSARRATSRRARMMSEGRAPPAAVRRRGGLKAFASAIAGKGDHPLMRDAASSPQLVGTPGAGPGMNPRRSTVQGSSWDA